MLLIAVRDATKARSLAVAVARFAMALTVFVFVGVVGGLIGVVAHLEDGTGCGCLRLPSFMVGRGETFLEVCPGIDVRWLASPDLAVIIKDTGLENELKSNSNDPAGA